MNCLTRTAFSWKRTTTLPCTSEFPIVMRGLARDACNLGFWKVMNWRGCTQALDYLRQPRDHCQLGRRHGSTNDDSAPLDNQESSVAVSTLPLVPGIGIRNRAKQLRCPGVGKDRLARIKGSPQEFVRVAILRSFHDSLNYDEFEVGCGQPFGLQQQVPQVLVATT